jgi:hypothetical protein
VDWPLSSWPLARVVRLFEGVADFVFELVSGCLRFIVCSPWTDYIAKRLSAHSSCGNFVRFEIAKRVLNVRTVNAKDKVQTPQMAPSDWSIGGTSLSKTFPRFECPTEETFGKERGRRLSRELEGNLIVNTTVS